MVLARLPHGLEKSHCHVTNCRQSLPCVCHTGCKPSEGERRTSIFFPNNESSWKKVELRTQNLVVKCPLLGRLQAHGLKCSKEFTQEHQAISALVCAWNIIIFLSVLILSPERWGNKDTWIAQL